MKAHRINKILKPVYLAQAIQNHIHIKLKKWQSTMINIFGAKIRPNSFVLE